MTDHQPNPNTPSWGQQPPQQHTGWVTPPLAPRPPKKHKGLKIAGGIVGGLIVIGIIGSATGGGKKDDNKPAAAAPVATPSTAQPAAAPTKKAAAPAPKQAPAKPKPKPAAKTVLTESGHGIKSTAKFTVHGDWDLHYTYDCTAFGFQGNFIITTEGDDFDVPVNELGKKGADVTHKHDGGTIYLEINSECKWTVKVVDIP